MNLETSINSTSIGQTGYNFLKAFLEIGPVSLFTFGNKIDPSVFGEDASSRVNDLKECQLNAVQNYKREDPHLKIWHIRSSESNVAGSNGNLMTFHETDRLTPTEVGILNSYKNVFVTSRYSKEVFEKFGVESPVHYVSLGFDSDSFHRIEKTDDEVITFGLQGKAEKRKHTLKIMVAWVKRFGGDPRYRLDCAIHNHFIKPENLIAQIRSRMPDNTIPWNVNILPFMHTNAMYNQVLNNQDICLTGMSGAEGFNLPLFQSLCLGKQAVVLNAHAHRDYCNDENSVLLKPTSAIEANDGVFFKEGDFYSQGMWYDFEESDLIMGMEVALNKAKERNLAGEKLKENTFEKSANEIYRIIS